MDARESNIVRMDAASGKLPIKAANRAQPPKERQAKNLR
jgi:hypothetical protein